MQLRAYNHSGNRPSNLKATISRCVSCGSSFLRMGVGPACPVKVFNLRFLEAVDVVPLDSMNV